MCYSSLHGKYVEIFKSIIDNLSNVIFEQILYEIKHVVYIDFINPAFT